MCCWHESAHHGIFETVLCAVPNANDLVLLQSDHQGHRQYLIRQTRTYLVKKTKATPPTHGTMEPSITIRKSRPRRWATEIKPTNHGQWNDAPGPSGSSQTPTDSPQTPMDIVETPTDSAPTPTDSSRTLMDSSPTLTGTSPTPMDIAGTPADSAHTPTDSSHTVMDSAQLSTDSPQSPGDPAATYTEEE